MRLILALVVLLLWVSACGTGAQPGDVPVTAQPPTGPGISQNSPVADIAIQLHNMRFIPPEQNDTGKWWRPEDNTTAEVGADGQVTITLHMTGGAVTCTAPAESFGSEMVRFEQHKNRAALLNEPHCS